MSSAQTMVIVGAGEAGTRAAHALREQGHGGPIVLIGEQPHRPYELPPLSKAVMTAAAADSPPSIINARSLEAQGIEFLPNARATGIDRTRRRVQLAGGRSVAYDRLLLTTGAMPRRLAVDGAEEAGVLYLRDFAHALALRQQLRPGRELVIIGGGFIGLELAASALQSACSVTLVEAGPRILMRGVPIEMAASVHALQVAAGLDIRTGVALSRIDVTRGRWVATLADGTSLACDAVIAGIGALPHTQLAEAGGLPIENGIRVDARLRTADPRIYAAGDCCSFPHPLYDGRRMRLEAWRNAQDQGNLVARNMLGAEEVFAAVPWFWSDQHEQTLQVAGLCDAGCTLVERDLGAGKLYFHLDAAGRLVGASAMGPNALIAKEIRLAEMLIAGRATPEPAALAAPTVRLKSLLR